MNRHDLIVIGAGPAGLFSAIQAAKNHLTILILEKQPDPGRKLLITGSGQCNFTNSRPLQEFMQAYGDHGLFMKPALHYFTNQDAIDFFEAHGVANMVVPETGKVFPKSRKARDILHVLITLCHKQGTEIRYQQKVNGIKAIPGGAFQVLTADGCFESERVMLATGGKSYPDTGSTGDGYQLAESLGHSMVVPRPGLTPFFIQDYLLADLAGTSFKEGRITLWRGQKKIKTVFGDWLLTHQGISGPAVQNLARYAFPGDSVTLALIPFDNPEEFRQEWLDEFKHSEKRSLKAFLKPLPLTQALANKIMALAQLKPGDIVGQINRQKRLQLFDMLTAFSMKIQALGDFKQAMVTCGGIALSEVNAKTMESRLVKGLYFAGEVLDIDGDCGGYDLQAAWSTAALAAHSMHTNTRKEK